MDLKKTRSMASRMSFKLSRSNPLKSSQQDNLGYIPDNSSTVIGTTPATPPRNLPSCLSVRRNASAQCTLLAISASRPIASIASVTPGVPSDGTSRQSTPRNSLTGIQNQIIMGSPPPTSVEALDSGVSVHVIPPPPIRGILVSADSGSESPRKTVPKDGLILPTSQYHRRKAITFLDPEEETLLNQTYDRRVITDQKRASYDSSWERLSPCDLGMRSDTLISPRMSPVLQKRGSPPLIISAALEKSGSIKDKRRKRSIAGTCLSSEESDEETEPQKSPPSNRRGRRLAIFDSKSLVLEEDISPINSNDEGEASTTRIPPQKPPSRRKQSSVGLSINYPGDLLSQARPRRSMPPILKRYTIADFANTKAYQASTASLISASDPEKKPKNAFSLLKLIDRKSNRSKDNLSELAEVLLTMKHSEFTDCHLNIYKDAHWMEVIKTRDGGRDIPVLHVTDCERKRREAVWELFQSECIFLIDHLMALKHCFMEPLKKVQVEGFLVFAEPSDLFGNLDELCYVSYTFCCDFIEILISNSEENSEDFARTDVVIEGLKRFCQLTREGEVYHDYCLNYAKAMTYLEQLRKNEDFSEFEKICEHDSRCRRLLLTDLLISPMQHCTKIPLLLQSIRRYTEDPVEQHMLLETLEKFEKSIKNLETKMLWLKNFERVQEIQQQILWLPITDLEPRAFIPEFLRSTLSRQPCERILASPKRQLLYEGSVTMLEVSKAVDMYLFLFDDILLITRIKKAPRKKASLVDGSPYVPHKVRTDGALFVVYRQPIALDRFTIHDVRPPDPAGPGLKNAFVLVQISRFQQIIGVVTLQTSTESLKVIWLSRLQEAQEKYKEAVKRTERSILTDHCITRLSLSEEGGSIREEVSECESGSTTVVSPSSISCSGSDVHPQGPSGRVITSGNTSEDSQVSPSSSCSEPGEELARRRTSSIRSDHVSRFKADRDGSGGYPPRKVSNARLVQLARQHHSCCPSKERAKSVQSLSCPSIQSYQASSASMRAFLTVPPQHQLKRHSLV